MTCEWDKENTNSCLSYMDL